MALKKYPELSALNLMYQFCVPSLTILPNQSILEEFVDGDFQTGAKLAGRITYMPTVIIKCIKLIIFSDPDWIHMAADRLFP